MEDAALMNMAREAAARSYSPYSEFRVGAVAVSPTGDTYAAANIENAAYPAGLCAETLAVGMAAAAGERRLATVAVACLDADEPCYPCGKCRQIMREFGVERVLVQDGAGGFIEHPLSELLPHAFGPEMLE